MPPAIPCANLFFYGQAIGSACPDCGHPDLAHRVTDRVCKVCDIKRDLVDEVIAEIEQRAKIAK